MSSQVTSQLLSKEPLPFRRNVVVFGESGVGKTSIVNMLAGKDVFEVNRNAKGTTFEHQGCAIRFGDLNMNIWDTAGLNESDEGEVPPEKAFQQLFDLLRDLQSVSLAVFVMRFRVTQDTSKCYHLMRDVLCGEIVPMVVAITYCDFDPDNGEWWQRNKHSFSQNQMAFEGHAIGTANHNLSSQPTYNQLKKRLQNMIQTYEEPHVLSFPLEGILERFERVVVKVFRRLMRIFRKQKEELLELYCDVLRKNNVSDEEADLSAERVCQRMNETVS